MEICHRTVHRHFLLLAVAALLYSSSVFAAPAALVEFALGNVSAVAADGRVRALVKGAAVEEGDTVNTNEGRVQLRFTDESFLALHTRTVFRIDQYRWSGANDGSERSFFSLIEGGLRTITGRLAKQNRKAYRMSTTFATLGIRGTEYTMQLNGGLSGSVAEGEIEVCNAGGCQVVAAGQSYFVRDAKTKPVLSNKQTYLPPVQPTGAAALVDSAGDLLNATTNSVLTTLDASATRLLDATATTASGVIGATQDAADSLLGGTALNGPVQEVTGAVDNTLSGTTSAVGASTSGLIDTTGALTNGLIGTNPLLGPLNPGF